MKKCLIRLIVVGLVYYVRDLEICSNVGHSLNFKTGSAVALLLSTAAIATLLFFSVPSHILTYIAVYQKE